MGVYYLDSSAVVKLYIPEAGSGLVTALVTARSGEVWENRIVFAKIGIVEVTAAIAKRRRMRDITLEEQKLFVQSFLGDCARRFALLKADDSIIRSAVDLTQRHPLRGYDAVHLSTALTLNHSLLSAHLPPLTFVSADQIQCQAAEAEGLSILIPT